jgi:hypothetical protein
MGNVSSTNDELSKKYLNKLCKRAHDIHNNRTGVLGGSDQLEIYGGYSALEDYGNSIFSKAKEDLIRSIAKDVAGILKINTSFAEKADLKDVISKFEKVVPNPRKGRNIKVSTKIHVDICKKLAQSINKNYKTDMINVNDTPERLCQVVSETIYSLFTGLHSEFLTVAADVSRIMKNLNALQEYVNGINTKLLDDLKKFSPNEATSAKEAYTALTREISRQHAYLANLTSGVIGPTKTSLIHLIEEDKEFEGLTKDLTQLTGTREFSDKLSYMMSGTSSVSHAAYVVDKALKNLGMSVKEYKNTKNMKDLRSKIYDTIIKKKPSSANMHKLMAAADVLYRNDLSHDDIAAYLDKKGGMYKRGGYEKNSFAEMVSDGMYKSKKSLFKGRSHANRNSIQSQLQTQKRHKKQALSAFDKQLKTRYNTIINDLGRIGKRIGSQIPVSDDLRVFIRGLGYFEGVQPDRKNLHKALSGYRVDIMSEYVKHDYVASLETIQESLSKLVSSEGGSSFKDLNSSIGYLLNDVKQFNDTFANVLTEVHVNIDDKLISSDMSRGGGDIGGQIANLASAGMTLGGGDIGGQIANLASAGMTLGGDDVVGMDYNDDPMDMDDVNGGMIYGGRDDVDFKFIGTLKRAIREIEYYFKIANIKKNLRIAESQSKEYTKDYKNILGEECGLIIDRINKTYKMLTCTDDEDSLKVQGAVGNKAMVAQATSNCVAYFKIVKYVDPVAPPTTRTVRKEMWSGYLFLMEYIRSANVEMIEAAQALDLYLSKFTEHIQLKPDNTKDFLKLLEQLEIVAKWFTDKSGDNLVKVFESGVDGLLNDDVSSIAKGEHYYDEVKSGLAAVPPQTVGKIEDGILIADDKTMKKWVINMEKSVKSMRALENIIAMFSKFNIEAGVDLRGIMSPGLIFKSFMKYTVATSIAIGKKIDATTILEKHNLVDFFGDAYTHTEFKAYIRPVNNTRNVGALATYTHYYNPITAGNVLEDRTEIYIQPNEIFQMSVKSMIAKVLTVVGTFSLFNRPAKEYSNNLALANHPVRQILGGAESTPKIITDATELYLRLTLMAEWYRNLFNVSPSIGPGANVGGDGEILVSIIPSFDGVWHKFVHLMFVETRNVEEGGYTEHMTSEIIESINSIYNHYKPLYKQDACYKILEAFVSEINLRYGLVKREEMKEYIDERYKSSDKTGYSEENEVIHSVLDGDEYSRHAVPSDKFTKESFRNRGDLAKVENKYLLDAMRKFRITVENQLKLPEVKPLVNNLDNLYNDKFRELSTQYASVDTILHQTKKRLVKSTSESHKYGIIQGIVRGIEKYTDIDHDVMLMFHETVINPLTILYTVYRMLNEWNRFATSLYLARSDNHPTIVNTIRDSIMSKFVKGKKYLGSVADFGARKYMIFSDGDYDRYLTGAAGGGPRALNKESLLNDLMYHLYYLTCDKNPLCELYYSGNSKSQYPMLSFKKMENYCIKLMSCVKYSLDKFRKKLPHNIISRYENLVNTDVNIAGNKPNDPNVVSLYYLQEHLVERLFNNKYGCGLPDANISLKQMWLNLSHDTDAGDGTHLAMGNVISKMVFWGGDVTQNAYPVTVRQLTGFADFPISRIGLHKSSITTSLDPVALGKDLLKGTGSVIPHVFIRDNGGIGLTLPVAGANAPGGHIPDGYMKLDQAGIGTKRMGYSGIYDYDNCDTNRVDKYSSSKNTRNYGNNGNGVEGSYGIIFKFNRLLYHYINMFTDEGSGKIYLPLLESFANGVNSGEIMKGNAIDDLIGSAVQPIFLSCVPKDYKSIIFATMAKAIKNIVTAKKSTSISSTGFLIFAENNLLNVSEYIKDVMAAYLPIFEKELNIICTQSTMITNLLTKTDIKVSGKVPSTLEQNPEHAVLVKDGVVGQLSGTRNGDDIEYTKYITNMLAHVHASAKSLQKCITRTYAELADVPHYFETYKGSISDYKNRNNLIPFMPLSHVSFLLNNANRITQNPRWAHLSTNLDRYGGYYADEDQDYDIVPIPQFVNTTQNAYNSSINDFYADVFINAKEYSKYTKNLENFVFVPRIKEINGTIDVYIIQMRQLNKLVEDNLGNGNLNNTKKNRIATDMDDIANRIFVLYYEAIEIAYKDKHQPVYALHDSLVEYVNSYAQFIINNPDLLKGPGAVPANAPDPRGLVAQMVALNNNPAAAAANANAGVAQMVAQLVANAPAGVAAPAAVAANAAAPAGAAAVPAANANAGVAQMIANFNAAAAAVAAAPPAPPAGAAAAVAAVAAPAPPAGAPPAPPAGAAPAAPPAGAPPAPPAGAPPAPPAGAPPAPPAGAAPAAPPAGAAPAVAAAYLNRIRYSTSQGLIPHCSTGPGSDSFKFAYGTRGLLSDNSDPNIELAPGVLSVLDTYNSKIGGAMSYDKKQIVDCFTYSTYLLRYTTDYLYHKTYLGDQDLNKNTSFFVVGHYDGAGQFTNVLRNLSCQTGKHGSDVPLAATDNVTNAQDPFKNISSVTRMVDNDNFKDSIATMMSCITQSQQDFSDTTDSRQSLRIYNILDLNIVPINFHAMQREIGFANIFNYSYTFDEIIKKTLGIGLVNASSDEMAATTHEAAEKSGDFLARRIIGPYNEVERNSYDQHVSKLMAGYAGLELGTPKYLSDQLWNKVLLNTVYDGANTSDFSHGFSQGNRLGLNNNLSIRYPDPAAPDTPKMLVATGDLNLLLLKREGYNRYNTHLVRNMDWFVQLQRVMRFIMRKQLSWVNSPIVHSSDTLTPEVTEYGDNKSFTIDEFE